MNRKLTAWALSGALLCTMSLPIMAADATDLPLATGTEESQTLPNSVLYIGTIKSISKDEKGTVTQLLLNSEGSGEYAMNISEQTAWIDSKNHTAIKPSDVKEGQEVRVFHSPVETRSLPPQSAAYAVVVNPAQTGSNAQYYVVESTTLKEGKLEITTDNGGLYISANDQTKLSAYGSDSAVALKDIKAGDTIMAWCEAYALSYPAQTYTDYIMVLPKAIDVELTRAELVSLLHDAAGKPVVNYAMNYSDVKGDDTYAEAVRWATSQKLVGGYDNGSFGPQDKVTREQLVTILWRRAGSPVLADYTGLTQFSDVASIAPFARQAMDWAHQKGMITAIANGTLAPQAPATQALVQAMLKAMGI